MRTMELEGFVAECRLIDDTLAGLGQDDWPRRALGEWTMAELVAHLARQADRVAEYRDRPLSGSAPAADRVRYFFGVADLAPDVARRARETAARLRPEELPAAFGAGWRRTAEVAVECRADELIETIKGPMQVNEYLATRVLEVVVHHIDIRAAVDLPPSTDPTASRITFGVLEPMLDGPRPRNFGRERFILAATGRWPTDDPRFPLLT